MAVLSVTGNFFSRSVGKKIAEWRNDWRNAEFEDRMSFASVVLFFLYMLIPFNALWLVNSTIMFGLCLFIAPIVMKLIQWRSPSVLFLRCSIVSGLAWVTLFYAMVRYS